MAGGPSHLETFDHKPKLAAMDGQPMPESITKGQQIAQLQGQKLICFGPQTQFKKFGKSGTEICELFPQIGSVVDDICIVRSMTTEAINHDPAHMFMNTGSQIAGRPSMGSWITYGLGSEADDLPGFVVLTSLGKGGQNQPIAARQWSSGFLPSRFQGVHLRGKGDPVLYLSNPPGVSREQQQDVVEAVNALNGQLRYARRRSGNRHPHRAVRDGLPDAGQRARADGHRASEPAQIFDLYGCKPGDGSFASNCLLARRLAERGVRFIQLYHKDWDHHGGVKEGIALQGRGNRPRLHGADHRPEAARHARGHADRLGRRIRPHADVAGRQRPRPSQQGLLRLAGRRRHQAAASVYGATDELGYAAVENVVNVHDLHATMLHLLGIDHNASPSSSRASTRGSPASKGQRSCGTYCCKAESVHHFLRIFCLTGQLAPHRMRPSQVIWAFCKRRGESIAVVFGHSPFSVIRPINKSQQWRPAMNLFKNRHKAAVPRRQSLLRRALRFEVLEDRSLLSITPTGVPSWVEQGPSSEVQAGSSVPQNNAVSGAVQSIAVNPNNTAQIIVGTVGGGVWRSTNANPATPGAITWAPLTDQLGSLSIGAVAYSPNDATGNTFYAGTGAWSNSFDSGDSAVGLYRTTNAGATWTLLGNNSSGVNILASHRVKSIAISGQTILVGTINGTGLGNLGYPGDPSRDYATLGGALYRSTDGGRDVFARSGYGG